MFFVADSLSYRIKESSSSPEAKASLTALFPGNHLTEEGVAGLDCSFIVEPVELGSDTLNVGVNDTDTSFGLTQSSEPTGQTSPGKVPQEGRALPQCNRKPGQREQPELEVRSPSPSKKLCDIIFATPKIHIPRKRNAAGNNCKAPLKTSRTGNEDTKEVGWHLVVKLGRCFFSGLLVSSQLYWEAAASTWWSGGFTSFIFTPSLKGGKS